MLGYMQRQDRVAYDNLVLLLNHYDSLCKESEASGDSDARYQQRHIETLTRR